MQKNKEKVTNPKKLSLQDYLKLLPQPPEEHIYELQMEKYVKQLLEKQNKKQ
jgi:hypothetical protein